MIVFTLLAAGAAACWGTGDFIGGMQARRLPSMTVALWAQVCGEAVLLVMLGLLRATPVFEAIAWGLVAGVINSVALVCLYRGLATGKMSIVAPVSACGALIPVLLAIVTGHGPHPITSVGIVFALIGIVLVSLNRGEAVQDARKARQAFLMALGAALGFGLFYVVIHRGTSVAGASPLWVIVGSNAAAFTMLSLSTLVRRQAVVWPGKSIVIVGLIGVLNASAVTLYAVASQRGNFGVAAVLSSLYPVVTVLLARIVLAERLRLVQNTGVSLALVGIVLLSSG